MTLWDKGATVDERIIAFSAGTEYLLDQRLVPYDCQASIAHATMLESIGLLTTEESAQLVKGLEAIAELHARGDFVIEESQEDCHTAIEEWLVAHVGEAGKKIHVGRSRNDQVLTALRLFQKESLGRVRDLTNLLSTAVRAKASAHALVRMPGYTHMRKAMPTKVGTWLAAFADLMGDDLRMFEAVTKTLDQSPLGTGAGYGIPVFELDREQIARDLGLSKVQDNPVYAHLTRGKYEGLCVASLSQVMLVLNRLATDLLLFSMPEFGYVKLPESLCTGSSIMPQKQNPDVLELVRGYYHVVVAEEFKVKNLTGNLMTGYQRDLGLTKESVIKAFDVTESCLEMMTLVVEGMTIDPVACERAMTDEMNATEEAYEMVKGGMAFREAYREVGKKHGGDRM